MSAVEEALKKAQQLLVDLSHNNRLLSLRETKARTIKVLDADPDSIYSTLVVRKGTIKFASADEDCTDISPKVGSEKLKVLKTNFSEENLSKRLKNLYRTANTIEDEQGYTGLQLAPSYITWSEGSLETDTWKAPLILIPVKLTKPFGGSYQLRWTEEDVQVNYALQVKLKEEHGLDVPNLENQDDSNAIRRYCQSLQSMIECLPRSKIHNHTYLDFFNFTKIVMYKDLDLRNWPDGSSPVNHALMKRLFDQRETRDLPLFNEREIDKKLDFKDRYYVLDADPPQIAVIEDVRVGHDLVVQGPPGTGKSQTIVNLISELLAQRKKVLFVSAKMAALDVVKKRLDGVGLGDFCLELHSTKAKKKDVLSLINKTLKLKNEDFQPSEEKYGQLKDLTSVLNTYAAFLKDPCCAEGSSFFELVCRYEAARGHFERSQRPIGAIKIPGLEKSTREEVKAAESALETLGALCPKNIREHPWFGCTPKGVGILFKDDVERLLEALNREAAILMESARRWEQTGILPASSWSDLPSTLGAARVLAEGSRFQPFPARALAHEDYWIRLRQSRDLLAQLESKQKIQAALSEMFLDRAFVPAASAALAQQEKMSSLWQKMRHPITWWKLRKKLLSFFRGAPPRNSEQLASQLTALRDFLAEKNKLKASEEGKRLFGGMWKGVESNFERLRGFFDWQNRYHELLGAGKMVEQRASEALCSKKCAEDFFNSISAFEASWEKLEKNHEDLTELIAPRYNAILGRDHVKATLTELTGLWLRWQSAVDELNQWGKFLEVKQKSLGTVAAPVVELLEKNAIEPEDLLPAFRMSFAVAVTDGLIQKNDFLRLFEGPDHEKKISAFIDLDQELITLNRARLKHKLIGDVPKLTPARPGSPEAVLNTELAKRIKHMSIRKLFSNAGEVILRIRPCVMMSPLSVAQYLAPGSVSFDTVIFDEASQVKPADAFGAILRGNQLVVIGDSMQLPPTSFFDAMVELEPGADEPSAWEPPLEHFDSILDTCKWAGLEEGTLKWHYRSEHESLIAVSNREFYHNSLVTYPSASDRSETLGLHFEHVPGVYDKGQTRTNKIEAEEVAKRVLEHYRKRSRLSLGVGTFNVQQRNAVLDEIERLMPQYSDLESLFAKDKKEHFFVKNLETIQGDERDVIFVSVGYGFDKDQKLNLNFGPVNQDGGERRLNVLMTRARRQCVIFANFRARDLPSEEQGLSNGVKVLRKFLYYAETGAEIQRREWRSDSFDSDFERSVADALRREGYEVHSQVGCAGYFIDLAIPNPDDPSKYCLGVECDGRPYHSSLVARERDRLRSQVLAGRGWKLCHVWSTDWYQNRRGTTERLLKVVAQAMEEASMGKQGAAMKKKGRIRGPATDQ